LNGLQGIISQKIELFRNGDVTGWLYIRLLIVKENAWNILGKWSHATICPLFYRLTDTALVSDRRQMWVIGLCLC
jgi:hypothetical protein